MDEELNQSVLADVIESAVVKKLRRNECGLSKDEMYLLLRTTCHVNLSISDVCNMTGWSARTLERKWQNDDFPKPHKFQSRNLMWWLDEVEIWMAEHNFRRKK